MDLNLKGKVVLVTGGTRGIGFQISKDFLYEGAKVLAIGKKQPNSSSFNEIKNIFKDSFFFYACDVTNETSLEECSQWCQQEIGSIDIVISNVGNGSSTQEKITANKQWNKVWDVNFTSALNTARVFTPELIKSNGTIIFISSIAGLEFIGAPIDYSTAKSALLAFAKSLSYRLAPNVRVNVVVPGNVWTEDGTWPNKMNENPESVQKMLIEKVPLQRFGHPKDISDIVLFLSSERASFITGSNFVIDGGQTVGF